MSQEHEQRACIEPTELIVQIEIAGGIVRITFIRIVVLPDELREPLAQDFDMPRIVQVDPRQGGVFVPNGVSPTRELIGVNDRGVEVAVREEGGSLPQNER
ncbi:MAG: hypothetical protein JSS05_02495 [Proteobacteria bacterium]|nr:hypothetical protein [Pseudomonadota bacterium]